MGKKNNTFLTKMGKSLFFTFVMLIVSMFGRYLLVDNNTTVEESNTWVIIFMCIGIIFSIFFCTFTILDEIKKKG